MKLELSKAISFMLLGAIIALKLAKPPEVDIQPTLLTKQLQAKACKVVQIIKQKSDGSSIQTLEINSADLQEQGTSLGSVASAPKKLGIGISGFTDKSLAVRYELSNNFSIIGKCDNVSKPTRLDAGIEFRF